MSDHEHPPRGPANLRRRGFLLALGTGGAATVAVALKPLAPALPESPFAGAEITTRFAPASICAFAFA